MQNPTLKEAQAGIKIARKSFSSLSHADDTTLTAESRELKSRLMKVKDEWKSWLKTQHSIMASCPIASWQIDGETMKTVKGSILGASKITADDDCSHEIKRLLGRKFMTNLHSILESRNITLPTKVCLASSHVWMWEFNHKEGCELKNWFFWIVLLEKTSESLGVQGDQSSPS